MREAVFLKKNEKKWRETEMLLSNPKQIKPDRLAELFIELNDDLSYAQTNYSKSPTTVYLNGLTVEIHNALMVSKKNDFSRIWLFWVNELPLEFYKARKFFMYSFIAFLVSVLIGVVSTMYDETFPRVILGDQYVDMTLNNIEKGNPFGVYQQNERTSDLFNDGHFSMFFDITLNNIKVSFMMFLSGITAGIGTLWLMFKNGVMLGSFQTMFFQHGLLLKSFLVVYMHGAIELTCLVISGATGLMIGSSMLFPKNVKRVTSLVKGAKRAVKIAVGLVPLFVVAGFIEGFVTRYADMHWLIQAIIVLGTFSFMVFYFVIYPFRVGKKEREDA